MGDVAISRESFERLLRDKVAEVAGEPDYSWGSGFRSFMTDDEGSPVVRVAVTNCAPEMDIWEGLRTPAHVGMFPLGLQDIWMHYAAANVKSTRYDGSPNPLAMPERFEEALGRFRRAVIVSGMLAVNPQVYEFYAEKIERGDGDPYDYYCRAVGEVSAIINKAVAKFALSLVSPDRAVVPMTDNNAKKVIDRTRSDYFKGRYHGPCNNHWPQNSIAAMTDLMRFGINRHPFGDEVWPDGSLQRLCGRYASVVIFDGETPVRDGTGGVSLLDGERLAWLRRLNDYADAAPDVIAERYCTYNMTGSDGTSACNKCIEACPSGALANSSPLPDGTFAERVARQKHRFWEGVVDFDFGNCCRERGQKAQLYEEYACARCEAICAAQGVRKSADEIERLSAAASRP